jgi:hypothetical protein
MVGCVILDPPKSPLRRGTLSLSIGLECAIGFYAFCSKMGALP